jgi:phage terminase large subunit-like protein
MTKKTREPKKEVCCTMQHTSDSPTLGPLVCKWIQRYLVHSEGDHFGRPFKLIPFHRQFISRCYELNADGSRKYKRVLLGTPKGNAKTEIAAALAICELAGPVMFAGWREDGSPRGQQRIAPDIPVAASSFEQADELFRSARAMISTGPLKPFFEAFDTEIQLKGGPGRMYRVAAQAGTLDGKRPTFLCCDEVHEWTGPRERVHLVLSNGRAKRANSWELNISTAGWDMNSLLGRMYAHGKRVEAGEEYDPSFLFVWLEASRDYDLTDPQQLRDAIRSCNPGVDSFLDIENIIEKFKTLPEHEFRRYFLNQWTSAPERWLPQEAWNACFRETPIPPMPIVLGFDGSYSGDSTAIVGCTLEPKPHLFVVDAWEKPEGSNDWKVDVPDVEQSIRNFCATHKVKQIGCDPHRWQRSLSILEEEGLPVIAWPSHSTAMMSPACGAFERAVTSGQLTHDGDERVERHINNCVVKIDARGPRITKDQKDSPRKIDVAVAAVIAYDLATRHQPNKEPQYQCFIL